MTPERTIAIAPNLLLGLSSKADGTMLDRAIGVHDGSIVSTRTTFCQSIGVDYGDTVTSPNCFSHSAGDTSGRFAVVAMIQ